MHVPFYIVIWGLTGCIIFFYIISYGMTFRGKRKVIEHKMCVLIISATFV